MVDPWVPITPPVTNGCLSRSAVNLRTVIDSFTDSLMDPAGRYWPKDGQTFCNIFLWDVTRALACEIPYWWLRRELSANDQFAWMMDEGISRHEWWPVADADEAGRRAREDGVPTVAMWRNPGGHGHVAIVRPNRYEEQGPRIAQAGSTNFINAQVRNGFGNLPVRFFSHP